MPRSVKMPNGQTMEVNDEGFVSGEVTFDLDELLDGIESLNDIAGERLIGSDVLTDIDYKPVRVEDGNIVFLVTGDPTEALECHYGDEDGDIPWTDVSAPSP